MARGKSFGDLAGAAAALGPWLWCHACGPVAEVLCLLWLLGGLGRRARKNMWPVSQKVLRLGWLGPLRPSRSAVQESSGNGAELDDALVEVLREGAEKKVVVAEVFRFLPAARITQCWRAGGCHVC